MAKIVEELVKGRNWTKQLQLLVQNPCADDVSFLQQKQLVDKILVSLTDAISMMSSGSNSECSSGEVFQAPVIVPASTQVASPYSADMRSVDSGQRLKRPAVKERKGGYKKRKFSDSWIKVSSSMVDEFSWRKYGQKEILNAPFPRNYFRCTHKHTQDCKATKQVQRIEEEPIKYQITYTGKHTCTKSSKHNIQDSSFSEESKLIDFQSNTPSDEIHPSPSFHCSTKEENKDLEVQSDDKSNDLPPLDWLDDLTPLMMPEINEDFPAGVYSHGITDMDFFSECDDFGHFFKAY